MNGFVLAGGHSTRMGRDKALLELNGRSLVAIATEKLRMLGLEPRICGSQPELARLGETIADNFPNRGPVAGIEAGLAACVAPLSVFLAVDIPLVPVEFLRWMIDRAETSGAVATIPIAGGKEQPLCAIYSRRMLDGLRSAIAAGHLKMMQAVTESAAALGERMDLFQLELVAAGLASGVWPEHPPLRDWFLNVNTLAQWLRLTESARKQGVKNPIGLAELPSHRARKPEI